MQFIYEVAQNIQLTFLYVWIDDQDGKSTLKTYRKPTHTGLQERIQKGLVGEGCNFELG